jgi:lysophospholipase L1-like esterase
MLQSELRCGDNDILNRRSPVSGLSHPSPGISVDRYQLSRASPPKGLHWGGTLEKREPLRVTIQEPQQKPDRDGPKGTSAATPDTCKPAPARRKHRHRHSWLSLLAGSLFALLCFELAFHNFSGKTESPSGIEFREYREGLAKSHFLPNGLRLTGNPQIAGAPAVLLVGDSHIESFARPDKQTMGSILERRLRASGKDWNVEQYGWSGADGPDYVFEASLLQKQFHPDWILLLMTFGDVGALTTESARLVEKDGRVVAEPAHPGDLPGRPPSFGGTFSRKLKESALLYAATIHFHLEVWPRITGAKAQEREQDAVRSQTLQQTVDTIMLGLKDSYGTSLHILYAPNQPFSANPPVEPQEAAVMQACRTYGMNCRSLRDRMINDLIVNHQIDRGFINTLPGDGHLNARGHEQAAAEIYDWLNSEP